jgi:hypothetical protein
MLKRFRPAMWLVRLVEKAHQKPVATRRSRENRKTGRRPMVRVRGMEIRLPIPMNIVG